MALSVTKAWNESVAFVKAEARLLFPLAFMLVALPAAVTRALVPVVPPGETPPAGPWIAAAVLAMVAALVGNLAISCLAIRPGVSVGEALAQAARRSPLLVAAALLIVCAFLALAFMLSFVVALVVVGASAGSAATPGSAELGRAAVILAVVLIPVLVFFSARLLLMAPVAAAERGGPFAIISRSWRLTQGNSVKLVGLILMLFLLALVLQVAVESVLGTLFILLAGPAQPGSISALLILLAMAALNMVLAVYVGTLVARIYAQAAGDQPSRGS